MLADLAVAKEACNQGWNDQLGHQLQALPVFDSFWDELAEFFSWLEHPEQLRANTLFAIPLKPGESTGVLFGSDTPQRSVLERVRFAAVNRMCVELDYRREDGHRQMYVIEPYSLRRTERGALILYAVKLPAAEIRGFRVDRIIDAKATQRAFVPRYSVDFVPAGPVTLGINRSTGQSLNLPDRHAPVGQSSPRRARRAAGLTRYVFKCSACGKEFKRARYDATLNAHKNRQGNPCSGRDGIYVRRIH